MNSTLTKTIVSKNQFSKINSGFSFYQWKNAIAVFLFGILLGVFPSIAGAQTTYRILAGQSVSYTDALGNLWSPDNYFTGGTYTSTNAGFGNTADPALYQGERLGTTDDAGNVVAG